MRADEPQQPKWELGVKLTKALDSLGWTDRQLAEKSQVSPQTINNLKRGYASHGLDKPFRPRADNVLKVARTLRASGLDISIAQWLEDAGHDSSAYRNAGEDSSLRARRMAEKAQGLLPHEQKLVEDLVDALLVARGYVAPRDPAEPLVDVTYEFEHEGVQTTWDVEENAADPQRVD